MEQQEKPPLDLSALPYAYDPSHYHVVPTDALHIFMCDLAIKLPTIKFVASGRTYVNAVTKVDELVVYNEGNKVGKIWQSSEYVDGKSTIVYNISSDRIQNQRGNRNRKHSRIYKKALGIAIEVLGPLSPKKIAEDILENMTYRMTNIRGNASGQVTQTVRGNELAILEYIRECADVAPTAPPPELLNAFGSWREKLTNMRIASDVYAAYDANNGVVIKLAHDGVMVVVDLTDKTTVKQLTSTYDLPSEYQEKLAILKIMENNQPIAGVGVKVEYDNAPYFFLPAGAIQTTC